MTDPNQPPAYRPPSAPPPPPSYQQPPSYPQPAPPPPTYGQPPYQQQPYQQATSAYPQPSVYPPASYGGGDGSGTVPGRTLGIVALIGSIVVAGLSILWLVLGIVALRQSSKAGRKNGPALAAIIISVLALIATVVLIGYAIYVGVTFAQLCAEYGPGIYEINGVDVDVTCS